MTSPEEYMLPCLNKAFLGFECPGCGLQRAVVLLFQGEFTAAFHMYPPIYTLIPLFGFVFFNAIKPIKNSHRIILTLAILNVVVIFGSYIIKIST